VRDDRDSIWTREVRRNLLEDAENLANPPGGTPFKQWVSGIAVAAVPVAFGIICIDRGHTTFFGRGHGNNFEAYGAGGFWLAVSYIALGAFVHFHYFWGLSARLCYYSQSLKVVAILAFLSAFFYALYLIFSVW
jgi:hypothetical protein